MVNTEFHGKVLLWTAKYNTLRSTGGFLGPNEQRPNGASETVGPSELRQQLTLTLGF